MAKPSNPYALRRGEKMRSGLLRILRAMRGQARDLGTQSDANLVDSIHNLRTLIKRLRAYLWFFRPVLGHAYFARWNAKLRMAAQSLSHARDTHAVQSALSQAALLDSPAKKRQSLVKVSQDIATREGSSDEKMVTSAPTKKSAQVVSRIIAETISRAKLSRAEWPGPKDRVRKALRTLRKAEKKAKDPDDTAVIHEWRKRTKRLYYVLQLTGELPKVEARVAIKQVDQLQELLGNHQDAVVAEGHLHRHAREFDADEASRARSLLKKSRKALLKNARCCWQKMREDF